MPDARVYILDPRGNQVKPGQTGQVVHAGLGTMMGYLGSNDPEDGKMGPDLFGGPRYSGKSVVYTGDVGMIDEDGYLHLYGRMDKMIKYHGHRIYPDEIISQIMAHPDVAEACVFHLRTLEGEGKIMAEVRAGGKSALTAPALAEFLSGRLPSYMTPAEIVMVDEFPRTPSGKIKIAEVEAKYKIS